MSLGRGVVMVKCMLLFEKFDMAQYVLAVHHGEGRGLNKGFEG